jgi:hypothetical protein
VILTPYPGPVAATVTGWSTSAATPADLLDEVWAALDPAYRVAAALLSPMGGAAATSRS